MSHGGRRGVEVARGAAGRVAGVGGAALHGVGGVVHMGSSLHPFHSRRYASAEPPSDEPAPPDGAGAGAERASPPRRRPAAKTAASFPRTPRDAHGRGGRSVTSERAALALERAREARLGVGGAVGAVGGAATAAVGKLGAAGKASVSTLGAAGKASVSTIGAGAKARRRPTTSTTPLDDRPRPPPADRLSPLLARAGRLHRDRLHRRRRRGQDRRGCQGLRGRRVGGRQGLGLHRGGRVGARARLGGGRGRGRQGARARWPRPPPRALARACALQVAAARAAARGGERPVERAYCTCSTGVFAAAAGPGALSRALTCERRSMSSLAGTRGIWDSLGASRDSIVTQLSRSRSRILHRVCTDVHFVANHS